MQQSCHFIVFCFALSKNTTKSAIQYFPTLFEMLRNQFSLNLMYSWIPKLNNKKIYLKLILCIYLDVHLWARLRFSFIGFPSIVYLNKIDRNWDIYERMENEDAYVISVFTYWYFPIDDNCVISVWNATVIFLFICKFLCISSVKVGSEATSIFGRPFVSLNHILSY